MYFKVLSKNSYRHIGKNGKYFPITHAEGCWKKKRWPTHSVSALLELLPTASFKLIY